MIYLIADPHGDPEFRGLAEYLATAGSDDLLIVLGDLGIRFEDSELNRRFDKLLLEANVDIAFIDGNHENYPYINSFPEEEWQGGRIRRLSPHLIYLMRGEIYDIQGHSFFVMGGCKSSPKWREAGLWYPGEEPTEEETARAVHNLAKAGLSVDYVLTHKFAYRPDPKTPCPTLESLCAFILDRVEYRAWYAGHNHVPKLYTDTPYPVRIVYDELTPIDPI